MEYTIKPKPVEYNGRIYRSRLEARYCAFYELKGYQVEYEPVDLQGWSPDFLIEHRGFKSYVEVKPIEKLEELGDDYLQKVIKAAAFLHSEMVEIRITGLTPQHQWLLVKNELLFTQSGERITAGFYFIQTPTTANTIELWIESANKVMFLKPAA